MTEYLTNIENLSKVMQESFAIWNKYHLDEGDIITLLAHLQHYVNYKRGIH